MDKTRDYIERINKVIDYIELNLANDIQLDDLAQIACLSKFHFHRIFYSFTNESLYSFVTRLRTERSAARLMSQKKNHFRYCIFLWLQRFSYVFESIQKAF